MPERTEPYAWVTDGASEWIGRLVHIRDDGRAIVVNAEGGRVVVGWTPWTPPPTASDDLVRADDGTWLCTGCVDRRVRVGDAMHRSARSGADARS